MIKKYRIPFKNLNMIFIAYLKIISKSNLLQYPQYYTMLLKYFFVKYFWYKNKVYTLKMYCIKYINNNNYINITTNLFILVIYNWIWLLNKFNNIKSEKYFEEIL